ncbi:DUF429 domain-containing protein [Nocardioides euryhalodurans]|uniref:DUF429 domain-containing protein n=1 Tax=Nocardioides euryhalodurans TaxID=2518370 RepID=UPI001421B860|nr:DUF429 domain-containing protein [Nocardioides euryhalodurans]
MIPPVLGVDACRAGWVGASLRDGRVELLTAPTVAALVARLAVAPAVVGIDIPIGLPDTGHRLADVAARTELPVGRKSSVFPTPARAAVAATTWQEANAANRSATGKGLSHQAFNLCGKVAEVDAWVRGGLGLVVIEVHPEVSFTALGADTLASKKTAAGRATREAALRAAGIVVPADLRGPGVGADDALDACAVAWTALRHARGESRTLPEVAERFSDGLAAAIHV